MLLTRSYLIYIIWKLKINKVIRALCWLPVTLLRNLRKYRYYHSQDRIRIKEFSGKHKGMRCFIIGNGPSLSISDIEALRGEVTFASNRIYRLYDTTNWRPLYWVGVDLEFLLIDKKQLLQTMEEKETTFFVTNDFKSFGTKPNVYYCLPDHKFYIDKFRTYPIKFSDNAELGLAFGGTVTYVAIQLAVYMGFNEIYLLGIDHNYSRAIINDKLICNDDVKDYPDNMNVQKHEISGRISSLNITTQAYSVAREYCEAHGVRIANATRGGKLDVFERITLEEVLGKQFNG